MHLPENTRRPIIYVTTAVLVFGGFIYEYKHGQVPVPVKAATAVTASGAAAAPPSAAAATPAAVQQTKAAAPTATPPSADAGSSTIKPVAVQPRPKVQTYKVVDGDTVGGIAEKFGLKSQTLLDDNDLSDDDVLQIGQELKIPATDALIYEVQSGDTLWDIASNHGADIDDVIKANPDVESGTLQVGQVVLIPGGQPPIRQLVASRGGGSARPNGHTLLWPAKGPITDPFGWRIHPVYGTRSFHDGVDIGVDLGTPLHAAAGGTVIMAEWYGGYGNSIKIDNGSGIVTQYSHMSKFEVKVGQHVATGDEIGLSGNTGVSTGPHLHFMVIVDGSPTDPLTWLP